MKWIRDEDKAALHFTGKKLRATDLEKVIEFDSFDNTGISSEIESYKPLSEELGK